MVDGRTGARKTFSSISCCFPETMRTDQKGFVPFVLNWRSSSSRAEESVGDPWATKRV